ncbi:hypothetical protein [Chitinimonas koreensis]|uniref:hypothetical protein n=1 Tax=Chitinimonas koreensis TaxID=356302 RepID=UPI00041798A4|nr:hypothetical protein [Chitinimonas koreensis]QNM94882.1 hypothetical protein H9L41_13215 [Chitinimonas koreensis]
MNTIDITKANNEFNGGNINIGEYVAYWISEDGQASLPITWGSFKTAEEAEAAGAAEVAKEGLIGDISVVLVIADE